MAHSIGKTIAELRKAKGWTQIELAEKLNVSDKAVSKWESEGGFPEITQLPMLAKIFDVSIDYLMTGKETEPEIITMSKIELCAKNDDVSMLDEIKGYTNVTDESGKSLQDYIVQYKSVNIFNKICDSLRLPILEDIKMALISNNTSRLEKIQIKNYAHVDDRKKLPSHLSSLGIITDEIIDIIVNGNTINANTFEYLISPHKQTHNVWYWVFPWLIDLAYKNNIDKFDSLIEATQQNNQYGFEHKASDDNCHRYNNINIGSHYQERMFGIVVIKKSTFEQALNNSDIETVDKLNAINNQPFPLQLEYRYRANEDEIRVAKLKLDKSITKEELAIQSTIHSGVVSIDELLELKDFKLIKKTLFEYPIHIVELLDEWFSKSKWKELYRFAVDNNNENLASAVIAKDDKEYIKRAIQEYFKKDKYNFNKKHFFVYENARQKSFATPNKEQFEKIKQRIIDELALKIDKTTTIGDLTKEYFENELSKGNIDMVVIKLCVRLETILKCDYHYDGELSAMLEKYCQEHGWEDDGWGYQVEAPFVKYLHKLRMKRNNIVHSEKNSVDLTLEELQYCIEYICKMG